MSESSLLLDISGVFADLGHFSVVLSRYMNSIAKLWQLREMHQIQLLKRARFATEMGPQN